MAAANPIPDALEEVLQSPSIFRRMLLIAGLRNSATGRYDVGPAARVHTPAVDDALRKLHVDTFITWLSLPLQRQKADINVYLTVITASDRNARIKQLITTAEQSIPEAAKPPERQLLVQDLKIIQMLFHYDY